MRDLIDSAVDMIRVSPKQDQEHPFFDRKTGYWFRGVAILMVIVSHYAEWWSWFTPLTGKAEELRLALTGLGVFGVNIFFFFSGYGLTKAAGDGRIGARFILRRIRSVYLPYVVIVGVIWILSDGFGAFSGEDAAGKLLRFLSGYEYWFMAVLFLFYIGFIILWAAFTDRHLRVLFFWIYAAVIIKLLFDRQMQPFWYVSDLAFPLGITAAAYEPPVRRLVAQIKMRGVFGAAGRLLFVAAAIAFTVWHESYMDQSGMTPEQILWLQMLVTVVWTLQIACIASLIPWHGPVLAGLGRDSLYLYLVHTYIFMRCVNGLGCSMPMRFAIAFAVTVIVAALCRMAVAGLTKLPAFVYRHVGNKGG